MLIEARDRNEYQSGEVVYYLDHDIPIESATKFLNEIERRAKPGEITILQQIKGTPVKFEDKWIKDGWRLFCYDDYKTSFKYNLDIRFERLVDGHFRKWFIFMNSKSLRLYFRDSYQNNPKCNWGDFIKNESTENLQHELGQVLLEAAEYIVPFFHSTKIIAATNKAEYKLLEDLLESDTELELAANTFYKYCGLPLWICNFKDEKDLEEGTVFS
ncbi:hypothetical protein [Treponema sp. C6A8]|uniref:hypothetical protein n=1 Tax=Treponema sp. C6A8 TaxID=1410609 RepID=UPI000482FE1E|nr:hypothetical protein [Treponema sp. C6A8]